MTYTEAVRAYRLSAEIKDELCSECIRKNDCMWYRAPFKCSSYKGRGKVWATQSTEEFKPKYKSFTRTGGSGDCARLWSDPNLSDTITLIDELGRLVFGVA